MLSKFVAIFSQSTCELALKAWYKPFLIHKWLPYVVHKITISNIHFGEFYIITVSSGNGQVTQAYERDSV